MKMQIPSSSLKYAREKKAKMKSKENTLESDISSLRKKLEEENPSDAVKSEIYKELDIKTLQLEKIAQYQTRGAILRSKARWYNEGEKNTKYFLNIQKRHFNKKKRSNNFNRIRKVSSTRMTKFCKRQNPSIKTYTLLFQIRQT